MEYYDEDREFYSSRRNHPLAFKKPIAKNAGYRGIKEENSDLDGYCADWAKDIIRIRGDWLVENHFGLAIDFLEGKTLSQLAKKYVKEDYKISPRTGRRIIFYALELLVSNGVFERKYLEGINPDPLPNTGFDWNKEEKLRKPKRRCLVSA